MWWRHLSPRVKVRVVFWSYEIEAEPYGQRLAPGVVDAAASVESVDDGIGGSTGKVVSI